jgi:hypothetical protein
MDRAEASSKIEDLLEKKDGGQTGAGAVIDRSEELKDDVSGFRNVLCYPADVLGCSPSPRMRTEMLSVHQESRRRSLETAITLSIRSSGQRVRTFAQISRPHAEFLIPVNQVESRRHKSNEDSCTYWQSSTVKARMISTDCPRVRRAKRLMN